MEALDVARPRTTELHAAAGRPFTRSVTRYRPNVFRPHFDSYWPRISEFCCWSSRAARVPHGFRRLGGEM
jgi:hypothetical protein